jgi:hypothetical protein
MSMIPPEIRERVLAKARADWPDDFEMQKHTIETQVAAHAELVELRRTTGFERAINEIFAFAQCTWPDDYDMELHTVQEQREARDAIIDSYRHPQVPSDTLMRIKLNAINEWPDDFSMQLHVIETQTEAFIAINSM